MHFYFILAGRVLHCIRESGPSAAGFNLFNLDITMRIENCLVSVTVGDGSKVRIQVVVYINCWKGGWILWNMGHPPFILNTH